MKNEAKPLTEKKCTRCKETKPASEFNKSKLNKSGLYSSCKACHKKEMYSEDQVIKRIYKGQTGTQRRTVKVDYTLEELTKWLYENGFKQMYKEWKEHGFDKILAPSVDRIDNRIGYTKNNIQLVTWKFNHLKKTIDLWNNRGFTGISKGNTNYVAINCINKKEIKRFDTELEAYNWRLNQIKELAKELEQDNVISYVSESYGEILKVKCKEN